MEDDDFDVAFRMQIEEMLLVSAGFAASPEAILRTAANPWDTVHTPTSLTHSRAAASLPCPICFEDPSSDVNTANPFITMVACNHSFCSTCMTTHIATKVEERSASIPCPEPGCAHPIPTETCQRLLSPRLFSCLADLLAEQAVGTDEKLFCPFPDCSAMFIWEVSGAISADSSQSGQSVECMECNRLFCVTCQRPWHSEQSCAAANAMLQKGEGVGEQCIMTLARENKWKQCGSCKEMIERIDGCPHMTCRCGHEFCYVCGGTWPPEGCFCMSDGARQLINEPDADNGLDGNVQGTHRRVLVQEATRQYPLAFEQHDSLQDVTPQYPLGFEQLPFHFASSSSSDESEDGVELRAEAIAAGSHESEHSFSADDFGEEDFYRSRITSSGFISDDGEDDEDVFSFDNTLEGGYPASNSVDQSDDEWEEELDRFQQQVSFGSEAESDLDDGSDDLLFEDPGRFLMPNDQDDEEDDKDLGPVCYAGLDEQAGCIFHSDGFQESDEEQLFDEVLEPSVTLEAWGEGGVTDIAGGDEDIFVGVDGGLDGDNDDDEWEEDPVDVAWEENNVDHAWDAWDDYAEDLGYSDWDEF